MNRILIFYVAWSLMLMSSCNSDSNLTYKNAYFANATDMLPWLNKDQIKKVMMDKHPYAFFVDTTHEFSYGFIAQLKDIKTKNIKKIDVSCDAFLYQIPSKVQLVIDIKNNGQNIFWQSQPFDQSLKEPSTWGKVNLNIDIPKEVNDSSEIRVYVWSPSKEVALLDNLSVKFE
ncbi:MAG: hypothetical protein ACUVQP_08290 [Bacteroidales bacterium]